MNSFSSFLYIIGVELKNSIMKDYKKEYKQAIDVKIAEYTKDLKSPLGWGYEDNIRGIIAGLREAKKIISKIK